MLFYFVWFIHSLIRGTSFICVHVLVHSCFIPFLAIFSSFLLFHHLVHIQVIHFFSFFRPSELLTFSFFSCCIFSVYRSFHFPRTEPNRIEPKESQTKPNRTDRIFKNFESNRNRFGSVRFGSV